MPVVDVLNIKGDTVGQLELSDEVFAAKINPHLLHETTRNYLRSQRAGTHKTKDKGEVSGAGRKLWRQKGTGRARIGSIRSPLWRHGGTVHGPRPRSYAYSLPRQMRAGALRSALSAKLADAKLTVIDAWELDSHKTKPFAATLGKLDGDSRTMLIVEAAENINLERASRNIDGVKLVQATALEPYDLLRHERLMLSRPAAEKLSNALRTNKSAAGVNGEQPVQIQKARPARAAKSSAAEHTGEAAEKPKAAAHAKPKAEEKHEAKAHAKHSESKAKSHEKHDHEGKEKSRSAAKKPKGKKE
jgi:large subunit ribosomal protein L4